MKVYFYNASCGDAFRIEFEGLSGDRRNIFIDSGYQRTFREILSNEISSIETKRDNIDLCVLTHIHDDHIGGVETYIKAILSGRANDIILQWWFNPPRPAKSLLKIQGCTSVARSITQGDIISSYLNSKDALPRLPIISSLTPYKLDGMKIYILSPDEQSLRNLTEKYTDPKLKLESIEGEETSKAKAAKDRDYHKSVNDFDFSGWTQDRSVENGSSIALLTEFKGKKILWLADAFPSVVMASLGALGYSKTNPLVCDYVKIGHHGSWGNNGSKLYEMIKCRKYILSTDGYNTSALPSKVCLVEILNSPNRTSTDRYTFYMTTNDPVLKTIFDIDGKEVYEKLNFEIIYPINGNGFSIEF